MMILDWLTREGSIFLSWWLLITLAAIFVMPICWRLFANLPDKGYFFARATGLILIAFVFWLMASLGFVMNNTGSMLLAALIVLGLGIIFYIRGDEKLNWREYWRENRWHIIFGEIFFFLLFFAWTLFRAHQNDTSTTEKPMELAFISGIMRSPTFPPNDPWMAGYSISYYHFGYIMAAMLSMLSGVKSTIGFSMTSALWFALTGITAYGVLYNMVRASVFAPFTAQMKSPKRSWAIFTGVLGAVFLILMSNLQLPLIELPWQSGMSAESYYNYWGTQDRSGDTDYLSETMRPTDAWSYWWWFRASRVLTDSQIDGSEAPDWYAQPISEFPNFSFILSDNHPHVLTLPFAVLALGLAFNLVLFKRRLQTLEIILYGILLGALVFLNTWDAPIYVVTVLGADALRRMRDNQNYRLKGSDWLALFGLGAAFAGVAVVAYLPFFIGFRSQAAGLLPNLLYPTYFPQFFIMFGAFILIIGSFLGAEAWRGKGHINWSLGLKIVAAILFVLILGMFLLAILGLLIPELASLSQRFIDEAGGWSSVMSQFITRRLAYLPTTFLLMLAMVMVIGRLFARREANVKKDDAEVPYYSVGTGFTLLLVSLAALLLLIPEFIYLRDNFGTRINTIFKFYYQAWVILSIASAYAVYSVLGNVFEKRPRVTLRYAYGAMVLVLLGIGLLYPYLAVQNRTMIETQGNNKRLGDLPTDMNLLLAHDGEMLQAGDPILLDGTGASVVTAPEAGQLRFKDNAIWFVPALTLDGGRWMPINDNDYAAVRCLDELVGDASDIVVAEATRDAYAPQYGRVASLTGIPIVLGWENHERQWRGASYGAIGNGRASDLERLYNDLRWEEAAKIIERYGIDYIMFGETERQQYEILGEEKFADNLSLVCNFGNSKIYRVGSETSSLASE